MASRADLDNSVELARLSGLRIVVGGGIGNMHDVRDCFNRDGVVGVIIGKALYTGNVNLKKALRLAARKDSFETSLPKWKADQCTPWNTVYSSDSPDLSSASVTSSGRWAPASASLETSEGWMRAIGPSRLAAPAEL